MEIDQPNRRMNLGQCQTRMCSLDALSICSTHKVAICNICVAVMHYDCDLKIKEGERFVMDVVQLLKDLAERINDNRTKYGFDNSLNRDHREELNHILDQIKILEDKIKKDSIHARNVDNFIGKALMLSKDILESQVYRFYTEYLSKLKISESFARKLEGDTGEIGLYGIRTQFYLNAKKKEMDFCENKVKAIALEMNKKVTQTKQYSKRKYTKVRNKIKQQSESSKNDIGELEKMLLNMLDQIKDENKSNLEDITKKINSQKEQFEKSEESSKKQYEELQLQNKVLKSTLNQLKIKVEDIENKQQAIKKELEDLNKEIDTKHTKQDEKSKDLNQRISDMELESRKSISEIKSLIGDISKKIKTSKKDMKEYAEKCDLKIKSVESSIQKDLDKKQEDYHQLIEKCDKKNSESHFELAQRVETLEVKLAPVAEFVGEQIQERDRLLYEEHQKIMKEQERILMQEEEQRERIRLEEEQKQMELKRIQEEEKKQTEERQAKMIEDLKLKDEEYYIEEFKDIKEFPTAFKKTREVYSKLGQHTYSHQLDSKRPLQIKRGTFPSGDKYIYFGQLEEGTSKSDGVGICVYSDGSIIEGCWKNSRLNRFGRYIYESGAYYIGEFKDGDKHGQGTYCFTDGKKYVGEWKEENRQGKGTEYTADGQISKEGVWADDKYVGKG